MSRHTRRDTINGGAQGAQSSESKRHALTARGLFALPLLLALALSSLVVVAAPQPVAAAGTYFTEDFTETIGEDNQVFAGSPAVGGGVVTMPSSNNNVVRTNDNDYQTDSFCAEITVAAYVGGGDNRAYLGFGPGGLAGADGDFPQAGPAVVLRSLGQFGASFADNLTLLTSPTLGGTGTEDPNLGGLGLGAGGYRLQIGYDLFAQEVRASVDGLQFGPTVDVSGYDFTGNGRVFFAGQGVTFDDFSVQPGPCVTTPRTFTVDTTADILTAPTIDGVCDDGGICRLREAILEANAFGGIDTIAFDIDGTGPHTIAPLAALPAITDSVIIDGYTQTDATPNTLVDGNDADIRIELAGEFINGVALDFSATDQSEVRGLAINDFFGGGSAAIRAGNGTVIDGNFIGTDVTGTTAIPNWDGIILSDAGGVTIGGADPSQRNLISGNDQSGIAVFGNSDEVSIEGNFIGTDATGNAAIPNRNGVFVAGNNSTTTTTDPEDLNQFLTIGRNVISGNSFVGVAFQGASESSTVAGNKIGVGADGVTPLGNNPGGGEFNGGISIINWARDIQIGGNSPGAGNLIGYNANGVVAFSGINNRIVGNEFVNNEREAISLPNANTNDAGDVDSPRANSFFTHLSANYGQNSPELTRVGIAPNGDLAAEYSIDSLVTESAYPISIDFYIADSAISGEGRTRIGTAAAVAPGVGNANLGNAGLLGVGSGEAIVATATDFEGNSSPFSAVGVVDPPPTPGLIAVDDTGDAPDAVAGDGVCDTGTGACTLRAAIEESNAVPGTDTVEFDIEGAGPVTIAPATALPVITDTLVIDGYTQAGASVNTAVASATNAVAPIRLLGPGVGSGVVGLDLSGSTDSVVRGLTIGGFATGIVAGERSVIAGNFIGADGANVLGNIEGVLVDGVDDVVIGGVPPADRNLISGNGGGIAVVGDADNNLIIDNLIGPDASGTVSLANGAGIVFRARDGADTSTRDGNQIGNGFLSGRNTIAGNNGEGISIGANTDDTEIIGNWIGVGFGPSPLGNNVTGGEGGIVVRGGTNSQIGGGGSQGNRIQNNSNGVVVDSGVGNRILGNVIGDNVNDGIVLVGTDPADPDDADGGANRGQNAPLLSPARIEGGRLIVETTVDSAAGNASYPVTIEYFEADSPASGEGVRPLTTFEVSGPGTTIADLGVAGGRSIASGDTLVATATDNDGNTSEFSVPATVDGLVSGEFTGEGFAAAIAVDGNRMAVGAPTAVGGSGVVYVYERETATAPWVETTVISSPDAGVIRGFGTSVDLRGDRLAVGRVGTAFAGDAPSAGRVFVFDLVAGAWTESVVGKFASAPGDRYGSSVAWIDDDRLAIGAPGLLNAGRVAVAAFAAGSWTDQLLSVANSTFPAAPGDEIGFSVAFDDSSGPSRLVAGAPGANRWYLWNVEGPSIGVPAVAQGGATTNLGSAIDVSGDRVAIAGIADDDTIVVSVAELVPGENFAARANSTNIGAAASFAPLTGPNDYLDIEGRNIVVGVNDAAGGVGAYRLQDNLQLGSPVRTFDLDDAGLVVGWAVDLADGQLTVAAPDLAGDLGAIVTTDLGKTYGWTNGGADGVWGNPANWNRNDVPTAFDEAIVSSGFVTVEADAEIGRLEMGSASNVAVADGVIFTSNDTLVIGNGELVASPGSELVLRNAAQIDGFLIVRPVGGASLEGLLTLDGEVNVTGTGELDLPGDLVKIGPGNATIDVGDAVDTNAGVLTGVETNISVLEGRLTLTGADLQVGAGGPPGLAGEAFVAAGAELLVDGDFPLTDDSSIGVDIDGDASTTDNFGRIEVSGALARDGSLFVNDNGIVDGETYEIVTYDSATGSFTDLPTLPPGFQTTVSATSISVEPGCVSWVGPTADALWSTASNWSTGLVPTASDVVCLEGTGTVVIDGSTNASVARFEVADQRIRVDTDGALTVNDLSFLEQGIEVNGVLTGEGDVVLRGSSTVTGTLDGLITVDSGANLVLAGGSTIIATATSNDVINLGAVVVTASDLLLGDGVSISNEGDWIFGLPSPQNVTAVSAASFDNRATLDLRTSDVTVDPGVTLDFGPASVLRTTIDGPSLGGDFGSLTSAGVDVTPGAELVVDRDLVAPYSPTASDVYDVLDCGATACVPFDTATLPGGLAQFVVGGDLVLAQQTVDATTFISTGFGAAWNDPANWSAGVPGPTDTAIVPADARPSIAAAESFTVGALVVAGQLFVNGALTVPASGTVDIEPTGILWTENGSTVTLGADAAIDGQFVVRSAGTVVLLDGVDVTGSGILSNSGTLGVTGTVSIADPVDVDSGRESLIDIEDANLDVGTFLFDARGGLRIDSSSTATFANGLILRPSSSLTFDIAADGSVGTISTPFLGFERYSPTDDDQTFARLELAVDPGFVPAGPITLFNCSDCAANPPDPAKGVEFDEFVTGEYDVIVGRNTVDVAILENKNRSAAGGTGFGSSVSVDGDRAVVGSADGVTGPAVLERVGAVWVVVQELTNSSSVNVTLDGDQFIADGILYEFEPDIAGFDATNVIGGTSFDLDGELALLGESGATAEVFQRSDFVTALAVLEPEEVPASYGADVALLDLGGGSALAAVSAPDNGEVYIFERVAGVWSESDVRTLTSPDGGGNQFGRSISISESALVVGEPLNDGPRGDGGAAWVYPLEGIGLADTPVKLTPSQIDGGDQFGSDVSIDGNVIVVGAGAAQKFNFPIRDGAAFVFQFDGTDWVETDELRAPDAFSFELFGDAVAVSGTNVLVGARRDRNSNGPEAGAVYDYEITPIEPAINTFIGAGVASWADPANWSSGSVPVIDEPAIVPVGSTAEIPGGAYFVGALTLGGRLQMASGGTDTTLLLGAGSVIEPTGVLAFNGSFTCFDATDPSCPSDNRLTIGGDLVVDGLLAVSATTTGSATVFSKSIPTVVLADDTSVTGDGSLFLAVPLTKSGPGTSTIGPDLDVELFGEPPRPAEDRGVLQVDEGTLDIQSAAPNGSFLPNGTIDVAPGASVSVAEDLALSPTSELGFGIDGPASSTDNFGQLQVAALTSAGTLRTTLTGYTPAFDDLYPLIACSSCTSDPVTAFDTVDIAPFTLARSADTVAVRGPELPVDLTFSLDRTSAPSVRVGSSAIPVTELDRTAVVAAGGTASNVAASSVTLVGSEENAIADIELKDTLIADAILASPVLRSIPLVSIDITSEGGWSAIVAGVSELAREPLTSLTLGQVLAAGVIDDPASPAGRVGALPLGSIDVEGTPLGSIPLGSIALGATPLGSIPLEDEATGANLWCVALEGFLEPGETCDEVLLNQLTATDVALRGAPLGSIPLGSIPLGSIDVADTPLGSIPLGSIDVADSPLGSIPLGSIPLGSINVADTPLGSIGIADAPLGSIPLGSIPLGSIPLGSIPLGSIPLGSIALDDDSVASLETSLVVDPASSSVAGAPLGSIPLGSIALAQVPLGSIPLEENGVAVSWCDVLADVAPEFSCTPETLASTTIAQLAVEGVPLGSIPLGSIPLGSIPLGSIDLAGTPLGSISLGSIPLGSIPLGSIPLGSIDLAGTPLGSIPLGSIPLGSIDLAGTPLGSIPLGSIPLGSIPLGSIPLGSIPLGSIPLGSIPLGSIPLGSIPLGSIPLGSINVEGTPLGSIPLGSIDVAGSPLGSIPLGSIPLGSINIDCAAIDCDTATLGEAVAAGAVQGDPVLGDLDGALSGIRVADLVGFVDGVSEAQLRAAIDAAGLSLVDLDSLDELTLLDIPADLLTLEGLTLADLPTQVAALLDVPLEALGDGLNLVTFADVVAAIIDPITGAPIPGVEQSLVDSIIALDLIVADLDTFGDVTLSDLFASDGSDPAITLEAIEPILGFISVESFETVFGIDLVIPADLTIADLATADGLGDLTLADLADALGQTGDFDLADLLASLGVDILDDYSLADLLFALLGPTSRAIGGVEFAEVDAAALPAGVVPTTSLSASFQIDGSRSRTVDVTLEIPTGSSFVPGSAELSVDGGDPTPTPPVVNGSQLTWTIIAQPGAAYRIDVDVLAGASIGDAQFDASASVVGTDVRRQDSATVTVEEGLEPFNFVTVDDTIAAQEDQVFFTYLSTETDVDVFEITVGQDDRIVAQLSNLDSDLDLVVWGRAGDDSPALTDTSNEAPLVAITDPDSPTIDAEPLDDFPQLDAVDPTLGIVATSNLSGTQDEALTTPRLDAGTYYVQVVGANSATNVRPAAFQIGIIEAPDRPVCLPIEFGFAAGADGSSPLPADVSGIDTLILINERRLQQLYGPAARQDVVAATQRLVDGAAANAGLGISPVVVSVDAYADVRDAYTAWDSAAGSCDPNAANAVVGAINDNVIDPIRDQLDHLVILGGDELIPMARLADETTIANEYDFRNEFTGDLAGADPDGLNVFTAPFWESMIRSDEPYGDAAARSLGDRFLYVSDVALGRVVETPSEIVEALDTYLAFDGQLAIETATVLGYDFLSDGSEAIADSLEQGTTAAGNTLPVDRELASGGADPGWTKEAAIEKLGDAGTRALVSLNAHFDHYRALPAIGDKDPLFTDNLLATQVATELGPRALTQSLIFSMGCHSGLSVSDITIGATNSDWAQTLGQQGSLYVGNTGYGYGDTEAIAYTEELMLLFAEQVTNPFAVDRNGLSGSSTVGEALTWAKNEYVSGLQTFSVYDEKAVMESTFYGLPFYQVGSDPAPLPPVPVNEPVADATGTDAVETTLQETTPAAPQSTNLGVYFAGTDDDGNEEIIVAPGRPVQPKDTTDISVVDAAKPSVLAQEALGAIVLEMDSTYQIVDDPLIASPTFVGGASLPEVQVASGVFPTKQVQITNSTGPAGRRQTLVVATGQYDAGTQKQRLDTDIDVVVYYADPTESDRRAPVIAGVDATVVDSVLTVELTATDAGGVDRVYLLVAEDPGNTSAGAAPTVWRGLDLRRVGSSDRWTGSLNLTAGTDLVEFIVQAKDDVGNVGYATNKATNFSKPVVPPPPPPPPPPPAQLTVTTEDPLATGWYDGDATVSVPTAASDVIFSLNGIVQERATPPVTFEIVDDGVQNWTVRTVTGMSLVSGQARIDGDGDPTVVFGAPTDGSTYTSGVRNLSVICADSSGADCRYSIAGVPIVPGAPLPADPGDYVLDFEATDKVGNVTSGSIGFTIETVDAAPSIGEIAISNDTQPVGVPVTIDAPFSDASAPFDSYTATIDWGDGTITDDPIIVEPAGPSQTGSITAEHTYDAVGVYDATVTIVDGNGDSDAATVSVVVFDPDAAPVITDIDAPVGPRLITDTVVVTTRFDDASVPVDSFAATVDWGDGDGPQPVDRIIAPTPTDIGSFEASRDYAAPGTYEVTVIVTDESGNSDEERVAIEVVVPDGDPLITEVVGPNTPQSIAEPVEIAATFSDESGSFDTYTATVDWGDGSAIAAADVQIDTGETAGTIAASRQYEEAGVYTVTVTIEDLAGASDTELFEFVVVFDPETRGRVSGKGYYWSGAEARPGGSRWGAPAFFGYTARYRNNAEVPSGRTQLRLVGEFFFRSTSYDYLIVNDAIAIAEGTGRIGRDDYRFRVQGIDNGRLDFFQISIWDPDTGDVIYDNGVLYDKGDLVLLGGIRVRS